MTSTPDEYTPSTDEVRGAFAYSTWDDSDWRHSIPDSDRRADRDRARFDRWLAAHDAALRAEIVGEIEAGLIEPTENCPLDEIELARNRGMKDAARIARDGRDG